MKAKEIKSEIVRKVVKTALQNKFKVTIANAKDSYVAKYGTPFRIRKGSMSGWDILAALAKYMGTDSKSLMGSEDKNAPAFFMFNDSLVITDPMTKTNESLNKVEIQEIKDDVQDWIDKHIAEYDKDDMEDLLDDVNFNAELYTDMLKGSGLDKANREVKDAAYDLLKEIIEQEIEKI